MWEKKEKKTIFTLNVDNYAPEITELTYPLLKRYAKKIGADFHIINERKFPDWPPVYEKLQIYELGQEMENDWNIYIDGDALVHPDTIDWTNHLKKDTVAHNGKDLNDIRWKFDRFFKRDGRFIGSCNWFTVGSDWCIDLWHPLDDLTRAEAVENISACAHELNTIITNDHLIDDYTLSRNIAKYGLKFTTFQQILKDVGFPDCSFFWHLYTIPIEEKVIKMKQVLQGWGLMT